MRVEYKVVRPSQDTHYEQMELHTHDYIKLKRPVGLSHITVQFLGSAQEK